MRSRRRGPAGPPGPSGMTSGSQSRIIAIENMFGKGRKSGTFSFVLGGTASLIVDLDHTYSGDFVVVAEIASQTLATLGLGVVAIKEAKRIGPSQAQVTITSNQVLSNVTVEVVALAIGV